MKAILRKRFSVFVAGVTALAFMLPLPAAHAIYKESDLSIFNQSSSTPITSATSALQGWEKALQTLPLRLKIPKIKVNAAIQYVGLTTDGAMDVPRGRAAVAWYKLGPRPGQIGTAVIDGHSGRKPGPATVFDNLSRLRKGDVLYVQDTRGKLISFVVREVRSYAPDASVPEVFSSTTGIHLNLITCTWSMSAKAFTKRLVVFSDIKN